MTKSIPLTRGFVALVDDVDYSTLAPFKWHLASQRYAAAHVPVSGQRRRLYMHRLLLNA